MKEIKLGKYLISLSIASGNTIRDKHFTEYYTKPSIGGVCTEKYFSFEKRHYLTTNIITYWLIIWCLIIGVSKIAVNKEGL